MSFLELAKQRYSVRKYTDQKVEEEKLNMILEAGRVAPTGANKQNQRILVIQSEEGNAKLNKTANTYGAPLNLLVCGEIDKAWVRPYDGKNINDIDTSIVTDHMMLQAADLGLGSVWICYFDPEVLKKEFNLPENIEPMHILSIGYADGEPQSPDRHDKMRLPKEQTIFFESL